MLLCLWYKSSDCKDCTKMVCRKNLSFTHVWCKVFTLSSSTKTYVASIPTLRLHPPYALRPPFSWRNFLLSNFWHLSLYLFYIHHGILHSHNFMPEKFGLQEVSSEPHYIIQTVLGTSFIPLKSKSWLFRLFAITVLLLHAKFAKIVFLGGLPSCLTHINRLTTTIGVCRCPSQSHQVSKPKAPVCWHAFAVVAPGE